jgi:biopolymer transport protein ExbB
MKGIMNLINSGGFISYLLILCSVISGAVIINRFMLYKARAKYSIDSFLEKIEKMLDRNDAGGAIAFCDNSFSIFSNITKTAIKLKGEDKNKIMRFVDKEVGKNIAELEKYTILVGTIANVSVYLGLLGTIIGIIEAFASISTNGMGGIEVVIGGVSKALVTTAFGLIVAIPAVIAYNYFVNRIEIFVKDMELYVDELLSIMGKN